MKRDGIVLVSSLLVTLGFMLTGVDAANAQCKTATILSSASSQGETISCGCKKKNLGGVARRATLVKEERAGTEAHLLVDAGDFGSHEKFEPWSRTVFQWEMMAKLQYDVVTPGPNEMMAGLETLQSLFSTAPEINVVSANITDKNDALIWPAHTLIERCGVTFAVTGVTDESYYSYNLTRGTQKSDDFNFLDLRESLTKAVSDIRQKADIVVVLLHTGSGDAKRVVKGIEGIDVVVVGHSPTYKFVAERKNETILINAGNRGQYLNVLQLTLDDSKAITDFSSAARALGDIVTEDPEYKAIVSKFNTQYEAKKPAEEETAAQN